MDSQPTHPSGEQDRRQAGKTISPELVRQVADRVYTMLLQELKLENERSRAGSRPRGGS